MNRKISSSCERFTQHYHEPKTTGALIDWLTDNVFGLNDALIDWFKPEMNDARMVSRSREYELYSLR